VNALRLVDLPTGWTILLDIAVWFVVHMGIVLVLVSLPVSRFDPTAWLFRTRAWEAGGRLYERVFRIRAWKEHLPDAAEWMRHGSFPKRHLERRSTPYLERFARETCRAEVTHLLTMLWAPAFFLWNPVWVGWLMIGYAMAENVPLAIAQRYNRLRIERVLARRRSRTGAAADERP
jgi:glycosyl-4,4'-diaponeurosporenoate acyltransferase